MERKGQAAMEFLMTYGWAILAAIVVIAVLAIYFRPSTLVSEGVILSAPLYGQGATISPTQVQIEIKNNGGETITTTAATLTINTPSGDTCAAATGTLGDLSAGGTAVLTFGSCSFSAGDTVNADVTINYTRGGALTLSSTGTVTGKS